MGLAPSPFAPAAEGLVERTHSISGIKNLNLNNLNCQLFKFYMELTRGYLNFSLVLSSGYIKSICSHLNLTHRPYRIYAIFCVIAI